MSKKSSNKETYTPIDIQDHLRQVAEKLDQEDQELKNFLIHLLKSERLSHLAALFFLILSGVSFLTNSQKEDNPYSDVHHQVILQHMDDIYGGTALLQNPEGQDKNVQELFQLPEGSNLTFFRGYNLIYSITVPGSLQRRYFLKDVLNGSETDLNILLNTTDFASHITLHTTQSGKQYFTYSVVNPAANAVGGSSDFVIKLTFRDGESHDFYGYTLHLGNGHMLTRMDSKTGSFVVVDAESGREWAVRSATPHVNGKVQNQHLILASYNEGEKNLLQGAYLDPQADQVELQTLFEFSTENIVMVQDSKESLFIIAGERESQLFCINWQSGKPEHIATLPEDVREVRYDRSTQLMIVKYLNNEKGLYQSYLYDLYGVSTQKVRYVGENENEGVVGVKAFSEKDNTIAFLSFLMALGLLTKKEVMKLIGEVGKKNYK